MVTSFEQGKMDGLWTLEQVYACGFTSVQECLEHQEQVYQDAIADLPDLAARNFEYAKQQAEYLEGLITSTRASLRSLL